MSADLLTDLTVFVLARPRCYWQLSTAGHSDVGPFLSEVDGMVCPNACRACPTRDGDSMGAEGLLDELRWTR
jgi:hypothetical protein